MRNNWPEPEFLTLDNVLALHERALERFGPDFACLPGCNEGLLDSAVNAPINVYYYSPKWRTVKGMYTSLAACYWFHISGNHPFADGNKRAGFMAADVFLSRNGYILDMPFEVGYRLSIAVASSSISRGDLTNRMRRYLVAQAE